MADTPNPRTIFNEQLLYEVHRRSFWLQLFNPMWLQQFERGTSWDIASLVDNIATDSPADADALETALALTTASTTKQTIHRSFIRGGAQWNPMKTAEQIGGAQVEAQLLEELAIALSLLADEKFQAIATADALFDTVNGAGNDNDLGAYGTDATHFVSRNFPYDVTGDGGAQLFKGLRNAFTLLFDKNVISGQFTGSGASDDLVAVMGSGIAQAAVEHLEDKGELVDRSSIAAEAGTTLGIYGTAAYQGSYARMALMADTSLTAPSGADDWDVYVIPVRGPLAGTLGTPDTSEARWSDGTTDGQMLNRRWVVQRYAGRVLKPEHIVRFRIKAD